MSVQSDLNRQVVEARRRAYHRWYEDGLTEITVGGFFLLMGLLLSLEVWRPNDVLVTRFVALATPIVIIGGVFLVRRIIQAFKERVSYQRTGYLAFRDERSGRRWLSVVVAGLIAAAIVAFLVFTNTQLSPIWYALFRGGIVVGVMLFIAAKLGIRRFYVIGVLIGLLPVAAALLGLPDPWDDGIFYGGSGLILLLSGLWMFANYIRQAPAAGNLEENGG
ncbi:MAG: hypothetical protein D6800_12145 [Candidatus Zixiibacteriota bacterium]|nr:MAG: hypothetical protein D6800_12145 [candidate division Zixibacteria bacterium]